MEQHPIPQQISSYQFRLVGDMTLKQFFQLAGGALVSLLFYASPLHPVIKWPFILFFSLLGVALAFLPLEERPLEKWIMAFFRSIYSPTSFFWQRSAAQVFYREEAPAPQEKIIAPGGEKALQEYLSSTTNQKTGPFAKLEEAERAFLSGLSSLFGGGPSPAPSFSPPAQQFAPQTPLPPVQPPPVQKQDHELDVPQTEVIKVVQPGAPRLVVEEQTPGGVVQQQIRMAPVAPVVESQRQVGGKQAQFSLEAAPPSPPTVPNTVVGQITDEQGKIIEGAIMEIKDIAGRPVRALKSNKLGHFMIVTPLTNGRYDVIIEKDEFSFDPISFEAKGEIIPPIALTARPLQQ